jgi:hypothetical protein
MKMAQMLTGRLKIAKHHYFALFYFIKTDFKVLQLLNGL